MLLRINSCSSRGIFQCSYLAGIVLLNVVCSFKLNPAQLCCLNGYSTTLYTTVKRSYWIHGTVILAALFVNLAVVNGLELGRIA